MGLFPKPFTPTVDWFHFCAVSIAPARQHYSDYWVVLIHFRGKDGIKEIFAGK